MLWITKTMYRLQNVGHRLSGLQRRFEDVLHAHLPSFETTSGNSGFPERCVYCIKCSFAPLVSTFYAPTLFLRGAVIHLYPDLSAVLMPYY